MTCIRVTTGRLLVVNTDSQDTSRILRSETYSNLEGCETADMQKLTALQSETYSNLEGCETIASRISHIGWSETYSNLEGCETIITSLINTVCLRPTQILRGVKPPTSYSLDRGRFDTQWLSNLHSKPAQILRV